MQGITCAGRGFEGMKEAELQVLEQASEPQVLALVQPLEPPLFLVLQLGS